MMEKNRVDFYTPNKMRTRIMTHERIKQKKEHKKVVQEKKAQMLAPNAVEKLCRIRRAQASYKS